MSLKYPLSVVVVYLIMLHAGGDCPSGTHYISNAACYYNSSLHIPRVFTCPLTLTQKWLFQIDI
jgi:hypothetical protein